MSRKTLYLLVLFLAAAGPAAAQTTDAAVPFAEGRLFRVTSPAGAVSHVFGTMHSNDPRVLALPEDVAAAFEQSRVLLPEIALSPAVIRNQLGAFLMLQRYPALDEALGEGDLLHRALKALAKRGFPEQQARSFPAWTALFFLAGPTSRPEGSQRSGEVLDAALCQRARARGMTVVSLETPEQQFDVFGRLSLQEQADLVRLTLDGQVWFFDDGRPGQRDSVSDYLNGRTGSIYEQIRAGESIELIRKVNRRLLYDRNHRMVQNMLPHIDEGGAFVAIGALHLPGEEGVLNLLLGKLYRVERIR
ncbi:MAG: TraB/GumN family protein [Leptospirales bacterium]|nr:TraB/GumN family protein [Leptospirales bacterium]